MNRPKLLLVETSADKCSVAIAEESYILSKAMSHSKFDHASRLTLLIEQARLHIGLSLSDLDCIGVSLGPGSYTGLRVGLSTVQGLAMSLNIPLVGVPTLEAIAEKAVLANSGRKGYYWPMIDARRMEVYTSRFDEHLNILKEAHPLILDNETLTSIVNENEFVCFSGNGCHKVKSFFLESESISILENEISAVDLLASALRRYHQKTFLNIFLTHPIYLKQPNITTPKSRINY